MKASEVYQNLIDDGITCEECGDFIEQETKCLNVVGHRRKCEKRLEDLEDSGSHGS